MHFFSIDSSSRHEKRCQMLQRLFWLFQCSKNPLCYPYLNQGVRLCPPHYYRHPRIFRPSNGPEVCTLHMNECYNHEKITTRNGSNSYQISRAFLYLHMLHLRRNSYFNCTHFYLDFFLVTLVLICEIIAYEFKHGLRTPNEGLNQRNLKIWANLADKICFGCT